MFYHRRLLNHFMHINEWLAKNNATADLDMRTFEVRVSANARQIRLYPQFLFETEQSLAYTHALTPNVNGFIGWLPYRARRWPMSTNKLLFKRHIERAGKRTPQFWLRAEDGPTDVIIKPAVGSFGSGQRGPFRTIDPSNPDHALRTDGEFYERFRTGTVLKAWYWNERPICVELRPMLEITGDGVATIEALVPQTYPLEGRAAQRFAERREAITTLLAFQGRAWSDVLPSGETIQIDYLYGSSLYRDIDGNANQLEAIRGTALEDELNSCGPIFYETIPEEFRRNTAYAVDGIVGSAGDVRWLEINSNPMFPADGYAVVLDSIFKE
ncbi:hypothetical protein [Cupriavidus sp. Marseille-Q8015]